MKTSRKTTKLAAFAAAPLFALAITIITSAVSQHAVAQNPPSSKTFAVGAITTATLDHVAFSAHINPKSNLATDVSGYVVQEYADGTSNSGPVTCLQTFSNTMANITFLVKNGPDQGQYRTFIVVDGGQPVMGVPTMDRYSDCGNQNIICGGGGAACTDALQPPIRGNIVVSSGP
jgi:hypothetical protein